MRAVPAALALLVVSTLVRCAGEQRSGSATTAGRVTIPAPAHVVISLADAAGTTAELALVAADPQGHLARIRTEDCAAAAVVRGATLTWGTGVAATERAGTLVGIPQHVFYLGVDDATRGELHDDIGRACGW